MLSLVSDLGYCVRQSGGMMRVRQHVVLAVGFMLGATSLPAQNPRTPGAALTFASAKSVPLEHQARNIYSLTPAVSWELEPLVDFKSSQIKFNLQTLMNTLRDNRHEGWVLSAYPDPKTSRPLIGAGFSLDLEAREHVQRDPLNPAQFLEPSSAQLWQAAGLNPARLQAMLEAYDRDLQVWQKKKFRRKIRTGELFPQIDEDDASLLLRVAVIQAIHNARAYCRNFDQLSGPQQMALTQLVYQMGVNLEQFTQFLNAINNPPPIVAPGAADVSDAEYWRAVQQTLIHSDWARRYSTRAISVIAMFDADYDADPYSAEARVRAEVHPLVLHRHKKRHSPTVRTASVTRHKSANHSRKS